MESVRINLEGDAKNSKILTVAENRWDENAIKEVFRTTKSGALQWSYQEDGGAGFSLVLL